MNMNKKILAAALGLVLAGCSNNGDVIDVNSTAPGSAGDFIKVGDRVFFGFDEDCVSEEGKATLKKQAEWLKTYPQRKLEVVGKCDERGTREYNIALGERRANNAANALKEFGVDGSRISVTSVGKDRPEHPNAQNENEHRLNRIAKSAIFG